MEFLTLIRREVLATCLMHHGGDGLEIGNLIFFRSEAEAEHYMADIESRNPQGTKSFGHSWIRKPVKIVGYIEEEKWKKFMDGGPLLSRNVFIPSSEARSVHSIRTW